MTTPPPSPVSAISTAPKHPIAVVSERTGLSQDILRIWERRYRAVSPARGDGGERLYSDADVERLRLLDAAVGAGRRIGRIAALDTRELAKLVGEDAAAGRRTREEPDADAPEPALVDGMLGSIRRLDSQDFDGQLRRAAALLGVPRFLERVVAPLLREVGNDWHAGRLTIAHEHFASSTVTDFVGELMRSMSAPKNAPKLLVTTPPGSRHVIGAALAGAAAAADGWHVIFLGAELPVPEIVNAAATSDADAVALSVTYTPTPRQTFDEIRQLREELPPGVLLLVGGSATLSIAPDLAAVGIRVGETLEDLRRKLKELARRRGGRRGER